MKEINYRGRTRYLEQRERETLTRVKGYEEYLKMIMECSKNGHKDGKGEFICNRCGQQRNT